jgi:hypothetical protein
MEMSDRLVRNVTGAGATRVSYRNGKIVVAGGGSMPFSGKAYIAGNETTGLNSDSSKAWVRCFLDTATAVEHGGPPPNPWPPNESWREKAYTPGHIVIDRA